MRDDSDSTNYEVQKYGPDLFVGFGRCRPSGEVQHIVRIISTLHSRGLSRGLDAVKLVTRTAQLAVNVLFPFIALALASPPPQLDAEPQASSSAKRSRSQP